MIRFLQRKEFWVPVVLVLCLAAIDFYSRLTVWSDPSNRDLLRAPVQVEIKPAPYGLYEFEGLAAKLQQPVVDPAQAPNTVNTDSQTRQFGDIKLKLLAIYQEQGFIAVVRVVRSGQEKSELLRVKPGQQVDTLTISNIESHRLDILFAGEMTQIQLFKPGSSQD